MSQIFSGILLNLPMQLKPNHMKKILCPVDFSDVSANGMEYASHLAKALKASLTLLYVRTSIWPEAVLLKQESSKSNEEIQSSLSLFRTEVQNEFGIDCNYHIATTTDTLEDTVASVAKQYDLVVMGTNGADNTYQYFFGSNTYQLIEQSDCPIVVVPQGCTYRPIDLIVYGYDPDTNPIFLIDQLKKLAAPLNSELKVLHIADDKPSAEVKRRMEILRDAVKVRESGNLTWSFDFQYSGDVWWALDQYMKNNNASVLALSFHQRSLIEMLFSENVIKKVAMVADYPLYVFWK
jgi:nucleotide-binding universal stress UspA family protein